MLSNSLKHNWDQEQGSALQAGGDRESLLHLGRVWRELACEESCQPGPLSEDRTGGP